MIKSKIISAFARALCFWITVGSVLPGQLEAISSGDTMIMPTREMRAETIYMARCMEELHYNHRDISLLDHREILSDYMAELDINHMIFLRKEVDDFIGRFSPTLDIFIGGGSLMPAFTIFDKYRRNSYSRLDWIADRLQCDWDFSSDDYYEPDRKKAEWPASQLESNVLWEKRLKYELLNEMMNSECRSPEACEENRPMADGEALAAAKNTIARRYENLRMALKDFDSWLIEEIFLNSLSHMYDPHSSFLSKTSLDDFNIVLSNSLVGIGAVLMDDNGTCIIKELYPGGPASLSKQLRVGDKILSVAQGVDGEFVDIVGMRLYKSVKLMRGEKGTVVRLKVQPIDSGPGGYKVVQLVRDEIHIMDARASGKLFTFNLNGREVRIGVISLPAFYGNDPNSSEQNADTTSDMHYLMGKLKERDIVGLVVDLRQNSGGLLEQAVSTSGLFIETGPVVQVRDSLGKIENLCDENATIEWDGPLIALTSSHSASASEIFVGALHDHRRAIIVGDPATHGKGSVQMILPMSKFFSSFHNRDTLGAARVTVQKWYLPTGNSTQLNGVLADIQVPSFEAYLPIRESDLPHALNCDSVPAAKFDYEARAKKFNYFVDPQLIEVLRGRSEQRKADLEEFKVLDERIARFRKTLNRDVSLNLEKRRQEALAELQFKREIKAKLEELISKDDYGFEKIRLENDAEDTPKEVYDIKQDVAMPEFDVQLRECLRIMKDWFEILHPEFAPKDGIGDQPSVPAD
ncbi:MAG: carboxy terminal-processing peptidase [Puniceicoccales bacterium]|jgi:carboxyl-terminal processing protease|nr:carboxy terminal-processing peptidase [Puniceicoccales bacterium]